MFPGPPQPLLPRFPLQEVLQLLHTKPGSGVWLRGAGAGYPLRIHAGRRGTLVLVREDLGCLLGRCPTVLVREGNRAVLLPSELLLQWRALQVVTATPYLPCPHHLKKLFPGSEIDQLGFRVPTQRCSPEVVLAECLAQRIPVRETRIIYRAPPQSPSG